MNQILFDIVRSKEESDRESDFVALGYSHDSEFPHSAFIINYNGELYEYGYNGHSITLGSLTDDYFHKISDTIESGEVPAFIAFCQNVKKMAKPIYGFFYSGESYNLDGKHLSDSDLGERMTCVGFCLNILKGALEEDYLEYMDWTSESHSKEYLENFCNQHNLDIAKISKYHRRITPIEFLTSGFFKKVPIKKVQIDSKIEAVEEYLIARIEA